MIKCVYKLNAPLLTDILIPGVIDTKFLKFDTFLYTGGHPKDFIKPEYMNWYGFLWDSVVLFYKPDGYRGNIHADTIIDDNPWAVNWIIGGDSIMEYLDSRTITGKIATQDITKYPICRYNTEQKPDCTYYMAEGAYLINGAQPHRATGFKNRYAFSLRCASSFSLRWNDIVEKFIDIIDYD